MKNMNDIEKQIAQNANNKTFEYKEAYWDSALATLQAAEKAKRRKGFFWIFFGALLLGGTTVLILINSLNQNQTANYIPRHSTYNNNLAENNISNSSNSSKEITSKNSAQLTDKKIIKDVANYKINNSFSSSSTAKNEVRNENNNIKNTSRNISSNQTNLISKKETNLNPVNPINSKVNTNYIASNSPSTTSSNSAVSTQKLEVYNSIGLDANTIKDSLAQYHGEKEEFKIISYEEKNHKLSFVINVGALASKSFTEKQINLDAPYLGGELYYQISNKFNASIGGGWYTRSKIGYLTNYTSTQYGFGKSETTTTVSFDKIYFVEIPLKINYALTKNHLVGAGATYSFILGGENRVLSSQTESGAYGTLSTQSEQEQSIPGYEGAYTNNSKAIFLSYEYRFKRLGAEARYHYGLNDITNDNIFKKNQIDRNSRFLITLKYLLFK